jgi:hypothetical protein
MHVDIYIYIYIYIYIVVQCEKKKKKSNNKYSCEIVLACVVRLLHKILLRLHNLEI